MSSPATPSKFELAVLEHLDAAHNLARWLVRDDQDAQDVVQESCIRALRAFDTVRGGDFRPWFLTIVRNTSFTWLGRRKGSPSWPEHQSLDVDGVVVDVAADHAAFDPHEIAIRASDAKLVRQMIDALPEHLREVLVLREIEGLRYRDIGKVVQVPIGTVMSRLARARAQLQAALLKLEEEGRL